MNTDIAFESAVSAATEQLDGIPGSSEWIVGERLKAFYFMLLDAIEGMLSGHEDGGSLFRRDASGVVSPFQSALREALSSVQQAPDVSMINQWVTDSSPARFVTAEIMVQLIQTALNDDTEGRERSAALADRVLTACASVQSSPIPSDGVDVLRYAVEAGYLPLDRLPILSSWFESSNDADTDASPDESESDNDAAAHE